MVKTRRTLFREIHEYGFGIRDLVFWRSWVVAITIFLGVVLVFVGVLGAMVALATHSCHQVGDQMELSTEYRFPSGCYVEIDGEWIPGGSYRATDEVDR